MSNRSKSFILILFINLVQVRPSFADDEKIGPRLKNAVAENESSSFVVWVYFNGKPGFDISKIQNPTFLVSARSIGRRLKLNRLNVIDETDFPVNEEYVKKVNGISGNVRHRSKWFNAVSTEVTKQQIHPLADLPFVGKIELLARYVRDNMEDTGEGKTDGSSQSPGFNKSEYAFDYGPSFGQVSQIGVPPIHETGNYGQGVLIGSFDNGFRLLSHEVFDSLQVIATYDFVDKKTSVVPDNPSSSFGGHGINTLSVIAGYKPGQLIGPAFGASFVLARTENDSGETPLEEDNWVAAIEWADSIGIDIATTSLIYREFDPPYQSWTWQDMNGNTTMITKAADLAASKGILVVNAAGNLGASPVPEQNTLGAPADGDSVLAAGAVDQNGLRASFSSVGPTTSIPPRIKPDLMAWGVGTRVASSVNPIGYSSVNGTSFACPLVAGVAALILHAVPDATPEEIMGAMRATASNASSPDNQIGWGIPSAQLAIEYILSSQNPPSSFALRQNYPNPFNSSTHIKFDLPAPASVKGEIFDVLGQKVSQFFEEALPQGTYVRVWNGLNSSGLRVASGMYLYRITASYPTGSSIGTGRMILLR